jgi:hypothetical protein
MDTRIIQDQDGVIVITSYDPNDDAWIFINNRADYDGNDVGYGATSPDEWSDASAIKKELTSEQVKQVFEALGEVFDAM